MAVVGHFQRLPAEVIDQYFLEALEREPKVEERSGVLAHARVEDYGFPDALEVITLEYQLAIGNHNSQELLDGDDLRLEVLFDVCRRVAYLEKT